MILSDGSSGMYIYRKQSRQDVFTNFYKCVFTSIRYSKYVYTGSVIQYVYIGIWSYRYVYPGISSSGMYIQASDIQDMYIQVAAFSMYRCIYRYQFYE